MKNTVDNWQLKELFHFDNKAWKTFNDTDKPVIVKARDGTDISIDPGHTVTINSDLYSIVLPNNSTVRYSDKININEEDFWENFNIINSHLVRRLKDGHIIDGLRFLDYHYKWTNSKKRFLTFIKHFVVTASWLQSDKRSEFDFFANAIQDWVKDKEKSRKVPLNIIVLVFPLTVYLACWILVPNYKELFVGAFIGGLAAPLKEIYELITE